MITAIPNQPLNFAGSLLRGCSCDEVEPPLLIYPAEDNLIFQMGIDICPDEAGEISASNFQGTNWKAGLGWTLFPGEACGSNLALSTLQDDSFTPVVGTTYILRLMVASITDVVSWSLGGVSGVLGATGATSGAFSVDLTIDAISTASLTIQLLNDNSAICFNMIQAYPANRDVLVELVQGTDVVAAFSPVSDPEMFAFHDDIMAVDIGLGGEDLEGCFIVRVTNTCGSTETVLESQTIRAMTDAECTLKVRSCNDATALGFAPTPFEMRLDAKLVKPTYEYEVSGQRRSNGRIMNHYVDRQRKMELRIGLQSEYIHPYLAALPVFAHFYIGQEEYVIDSDAYEPLYGDAQDGTGGIVLSVRPKEELFRRVQCAEEGPGCVAPPNLWVQGTGPNNNLITTEDNKAILIHP